MGLDKPVFPRKTGEEKKKMDLKQGLEDALRREEPGAEIDVDVARAAGEITYNEAHDIKRRSEEDSITKVAKSMSLDDLARGIPKMTANEKEIIRPIFKWRRGWHHDDGEAQTASARRPRVRLLT